ncbi:MFS transporter [Pseudomonas sp. zfem002]|uniref:MFS transporter n=1 Tax=Pseudomonas sp. zfem002 TaxID=3078197 RepID=UPI0029279516|nr:MFS transporter [Pseudomonas sp. zfem002]MDU9390322.1 MFS transporter [Pseudomonas sp. zfem002]
MPVEITTIAASLPIRRQPWLALLAAVCLAALILPLSFTGAVVATPVISRDLGAGALASSWITNAFMLSFGSLLMAAGAAADAFGRKRVFMCGVSLFAFASIVIAWVPDILWLDVLRAVQGGAAAAALAGGSAALAQAFDGVARTRAFSLLGTCFGAGLAFGPVLAGAIIAHLGWRSVFFSSAILGALALLLAVSRMPESRDPNATGFDWTGAATFTSTLGLFTWGVLLLPVSGWGAWQAWTVLLGAAVSGAVFLHVERRVARPMLDLSLFRYPRFLGVQLLPVATCYCYVVLLVLLPLRFIGLEGLDEVDAGLQMIALSIPMLIVPGLAAGLSRWISPGRISAFGLFVAAAGLYWLGEIEPTDSRTSLLWPLLVVGIGTGLPWGLMDGLAVSVVPKERAGMAAGIFSTTRVAGEGVAIAIVGALLTLSIELHLPSHSAAARDLAMGDLAAAQRFSHLGLDTLLGIYGDAFRWLVRFLLVVTLGAGVVVGWLLADAE